MATGLPAPEPASAGSGSSKRGVRRRVLRGALLPFPPGPRFCLLHRGQVWGRSPAGQVAVSGLRDSALTTACSSLLACRPSRLRALGLTPLFLLCHLGGRLTLNFFTQSLSGAFPPSLFTRWLFRAVLCVLQFMRTLTRC